MQKRRPKSANDPAPVTTIVVLGDDVCPDRSQSSNAYYTVTSDDESETKCIANGTPFHCLLALMKLCDVGDLAHLQVSHLPMEIDRAMGRPIGGTSRSELELIAHGRGSQK